MSSSLTRLCLSTLLTMLGFAAITPVMVVQLSQQGYSPAGIGVFSALVYVGVWLVAPFQLQLAARFGNLSSYQAGKILTVLATLGLSHAHGTGMWAGLLLLLGMGGALVWPPTDALVADHAPSSKEGSVTGLYHTGIAAVFAVGPLISALLMKRMEFVYYGAAFLAAASSFTLFRVKFEEEVAPPSDGEAESFAWRPAAGLIFISFLGGFFENATHTASLLVALFLKWTESAAVALPGIIVVGSLLIQYSAGRMADAYGPKKVLFGAMGIMALSSASLPLVTTWQPSLWIIAVFWGAAGGCLYTLAMTSVARDYSGSASAVATMLIVVGYTAGSTLGPLVGGVLVEISPLHGAAWTFSILAVIAILFGRKSTL